MIRNGISRAAAGRLAFRWFWVGVVLPFSVAAVTGCVGGGHDRPRLAISPDPVALPATEPGESAERLVRVWNQGDAAVTLEEIQGPQAPFALTPPAGGATECSVGAVLAPQTYCVVAIRFAPLAVGSFEGRITVRSAGEATVGARLLGRGQAFCTRRGIR
jgi:hypothetical protein